MQPSANIFPPHWAFRRGLAGTGTIFTLAYALTLVLTSVGAGVCAGCDCEYQHASAREAVHGKCTHAQKRPRADSR
jgi:hypothetical protein